MDSTLTFTLAPKQEVHVHLTDPAQRRIVSELAQRTAAQDREIAELERAYHLGGKPTAGCGYDDRLTVRLGLSRKTLLGLLELYRAGGGKHGGLRSTRVGGRHMVSELAVREWLGDAPAQRSAE